MRVIILANGLGTRWIPITKVTSHVDITKSYPDYANYAKFPPKQLFYVGEKTVIQRTIDMIKDYGISQDILVSAPRIVRKTLRDVECVSPSYSGELLSGILQMFQYWDHSGTLFLLGDVVFSHDLLHKISHSLDMTFIGRLGQNPITGKEASELFGVYVESSFKLLRKLCNKLVIENEHSAKLWALYKEFCHLNNIEWQKENPYLLNSTDYTDDCDSPEEFFAFWEALVLAALEDDGKGK